MGSLRVQKAFFEFPVCWTKHHVMGAYWESEGIAPRILDLGTRWRWMVSFTHRPLNPQGKIPWYPLDRRLGGTQSWSGRGVEEKNSQPLAGTRTPNHPACTTELSRFLHEKRKMKGMLFVGGEGRGGEGVQCYCPRNWWVSRYLLKYKFIRLKYLDEEMKSYRPWTERGVDLWILDSSFLLTLSHLIPKWNPVLSRRETKDIFHEPSPFMSSVCE
jgi:hypothetical protein